MVSSMWQLRSSISKYCFLDKLGVSKGFSVHALTVNFFREADKIVLTCKIVQIKVTLRNHFDAPASAVLTNTIIDGFTSGVGGIGSNRASFTSGHLFVPLVSAIRASLTRIHTIVGRIFSCSANGYHKTTTTTTTSVAPLLIWKQRKTTRQLRPVF